MSYLDKFKTEAVVAALGFNDGANKGFWRIQPRDRIKRWIEMGAEIRAAIKANGKIVNAHGRSVGSTGNPDEVRVLFEGLGHLGISDGIYSVPSRFVEKVTAVLPEEYVKNKGGKLATDVKPLSTDGDVPEIASLERADVTPDDIRIANEGINSPEGQEQELFKDSPEGKAIAELPVGEAKPASKKQIADVIDTPSDANYAPEKYVTHAINKAGNDEAVDLDELIDLARKAPRPVSSLKGIKRNEKPNSMQPGDIFENYGTEYEFESVVPGSRDRISKTEMVVAKDRNTGEVSEIILDTDVATPVFRPDANQPEPEPTPTPEPIPTPESVVVEEPATAPDDGRNNPPKEPETATSSLKKAKDLSVGDHIVEEGTPGTLKVVSGEIVDGKVTVQVSGGKGKKSERSYNSEDDVAIDNELSSGEIGGLPDNSKPPVEAPFITALREGREDKGEDIEMFSPKTEDELFETKIEAILDENGKKARFFNPETGKVQTLENPDAIEAQLLVDFPNAVINDKKELVLERTKLTDANGDERQIESKIVRVDGNSFLVAFKVDNLTQGTSETYYNQAYRHSYQAIHGKTNSVQRLSRILKGEEIPIKNTKSPEYKYYFGENSTVEGRLGYFRRKHNSSVTEDKLIGNLDLALEESGGEETDKVKAARRDLSILYDDFGGDIELYRAYDTNQKQRMLTIKELMDKFASGRSMVINESEAQLGNVMRGEIDGVYRSLREGQTAGAAQAIKELKHRLPMVSRDPEVYKLMLETLREGIRARYAKGDRRSVGGFLSSGNNIARNGVDPDSAEQVPHVSKEGLIVRKGNLVRYTNNNKEISYGVVSKINDLEKNAFRPNQYADTVSVRFLNSDGTMSAPITLSTKYMTVIEKDGTTPEARAQMTKYTGRMEGEEKIATRLGQNRLALFNDYNADPNETDGDINPELDVPNLGSEGVSGDEGEDGDGTPNAEGGQIEDLNAGDSFFGKNGELLGDILEIQPVVDKKGNAGFAVLYRDANGDIKRQAVKAGEFRGPKL